MSATTYHGQHDTLHDKTHGHHGHEAGPNVVFGFWMYLMTDCIIFATLFAGFAVSRKQFAGGPTGAQIFDLNGVAWETGCLLLSSVTYGFAMLAAYHKKLPSVIAWLMVTFALGAGFIGLEIHEFIDFVSAGNGPDRSAFLSSFFALVGTHGFHVTCGLIWMSILMFQLVVLKKGLTPAYMNRLACLSLFWHFLDIVWICVFTIVYQMSVIG